tara:strand:+ start:1281 stop:1448 length:168 start_codon:yes stop_codon:yes gene_type:complete
MQDKVTEEEFAQYRDVQDSGMFNMFSPQAREMTTLSKDQWIYILRNYDELREKYE